MCAASSSCASRDYPSQPHSSEEVEERVDGLMMDYQLTLPTLVRRAETVFPGQQIVSRLADKSFHRITYKDSMRRAKQLAVALRQLGLERGDRVATLCWNHYAHHEAYFGIPCAGLVMHTLNLRLHPDDLGYIANHGGAKAVIVDESLLPLLDQFKGRTQIEHVFVVGDGDAPDGSYEELLASANADDWEDPGLDENEAAAMCYTSGTTGLPKGVVYSHRSTVLHSFGVGFGAPLGHKLSEESVVMPVVPMFHANAWGYPYVAVMAGAKLVYPGPSLDGESLLENIDRERVTWAAGVPTIWLGILQQLDGNPDRWDLSALEAMLVGGSAVPRSLIAAFKERYGIDIVQGWGMTETSPVAANADLPGELRQLEPDAAFDKLALAGLPLPFVEIRGRDEDGGLIPWDGESMGELEVRGPWVAKAYYDPDGDANETRWTEDGWFRTGDVVSIHPDAYIQIKDRSKDVIKSGGEWISSVELENALMGHPAIAEAAVIAVPDEKWAERPLAAIVLKDGRSATADELREYLAPKFAKFWLPDRFEFVEEIPKTSVGKFKKTALREQFTGSASAVVPS
jgi:fatty-acyl-CoA synthase